MNPLAQALDKQGQRAEARALYGEVLERRRADPTTKPEHLAQSISNYASVLGPEREDEAAALFKEALAIQATIVPADDYQAAKMLHNRLWIGFYEIEPTADDIAALRHGLEVLQERAGPTARITASMTLLLGKMLQRVEGSDAAEIEALLRASTEAFSPDSDMLSAALMWWGGQLRDMGRLEEALVALERCEVVRQQVPGSDPSAERAAAQRATVLRELGRDAEADQVLAEHPGAERFIGSAALFE